MKSMEWAMLLDILVDLVQNSSNYNEETAKKLKELINYVGKL